MTQPDALRLAERIDGWLHQDEMNIEDAMEAAAELRRLYRVSEDLRESLNHKTYYQLRLSKYIEDMKSQRNELLEVVHDAIATLHHIGYPTAASDLRAAVAKAEKK